MQKTPKKIDSYWQHTTFTATVDIFARLGKSYSYSFETVHHIFFILFRYVPLLLSLFGSKEMPANVSQGDFFLRSA